MKKRARGDTLTARASSKPGGKAELKALYLKCLGGTANDIRDLTSVVRRLLGLGVDWRDLLRWAREPGHRERYVRKVLSQILCEAGIRRRKPGGGRATPQEALALMAYAQRQFQERAARFLLAAYRAAKLQEHSQTGQPQVVPLKVL